MFFKKVRWGQREIGLFECRAMPRQLQNVCLMKHPATWPWFDPSLTGAVSDNVLDGCTDPLRRGQPLVSK